MNRSQHRSASPPTCPRGHRGFSLLEVIISTAILAASALMLTSLFATGDRHTARAEERTFAQMLCQTKLDEFVAKPSQLISMHAEGFQQYPGWVWSADVQPTTLRGFVRLHVSVTRIPGMPTGADLTIASVPTGESPTTMFRELSASPTFELTRWMRYEGEITAAEGLDASSSLLDRLEAQAK